MHSNTLDDTVTPDVTVLIVSDYAGGEAKAWDDIRKTLRALAGQDFEGNVEYLLVESSEVADDVPDDLDQILPGLLLKFTLTAVAYGSSYKLKNYGVSSARSDLVAVLDGDCIPARGWLREAVSAIKSRPDVAATSGKTTYAGRSPSERILGVLSRAYIDRRKGRDTPFISNNNAIFRRLAFMEHPLPTQGGPFAARIQSEALKRAGYRLAFSREMRVTHDFEGWAMERDIRRNIGWSTIRVRQIDPDVPHAWAARMGPLSVVFFYSAHTVESCWNVLRVGRHYGLRWYEFPLALTLTIFVHGLEIGGMITALTGREISATAYR